MQKDFDSSWQRTVAAESSVVSLYKELDEVTAKFGNIDMESSTLWMKYKSSSEMPFEAKAGFTMDRRETRDNLMKKTKECAALRAKIPELGKERSTLYGFRKVNV